MSEKILYCIIIFLFTISSQLSAKNNIPKVFAKFSDDKIKVLKPLEAKIEHKDNQKIISTVEKLQKTPNTFLWEQRVLAGKALHINIEDKSGNIWPSSAVFYSKKDKYIAKIKPIYELPKKRLMSLNAYYVDSNKQRHKIWQIFFKVSKGNKYILPWLK